MRISPERLSLEARTSGFRPDVLEKVLQLLSLLESIRSHLFLKTRLALKGGTALNLFIFPVPRLSVDIDLNYIGAPDLETTKRERPRIEEAIQAVCARQELTVRKMPGDHAGGKWQLRYPSAAGGQGNLEVDVNFMFRVPLWPPSRRKNSRRYLNAAASPGQGRSRRARSRRYCAGCSDETAHSGTPVCPSH